MATPHSKPRHRRSACAPPYYTPLALALMAASLTTTPHVFAQMSAPTESALSTVTITGTGDDYGAPESSTDTRT